ncbi:MAG: aldo/keto reductase [Terriglobia bacterium]|jgi:aryl-alcohol dehydrogenase-like predicted oxidoreductase
MEDLIPLGKTDIRISPLGLGTWQWGDRMMWGYGKTHTDSDLHDAFQVSLQSGISFFDTAEVYGKGRSEELLGACLKEAGQSPLRAPLVVATKFMPYPWRLRKGMLLSKLRASLARLRLERVDLYQIHWPFRPVPIETWANALADAVEAGLTRAVGVSNYNSAQMLRAHSALAKRGIALASNQVEFHLLNRRVEQKGLLKLCRELGVTLIAYSPLAKGLLTGKYSPQTRPHGMRRYLFRRARLGKIQPLIQLLRAIGDAHDGKSPAQIALNWVICKGAVPIPGAKNARQARDNAAALGWRLAEAEIAALDAESQKLSIA